MPTRSSLFDQIEVLDTCNISDALDRLQLHGATTGIGRLAGPARMLAGWATTTRVSAARPCREAVHVGTLAVEHAGPANVVVVDGGGREGVSAWGGILSAAAQARGVGGVVIDGACRDIDMARSLGFAVFARAVVPVSARGRIWHESVQEPVQCGGVSVVPGDLVVADSNGVVFVERRHVDAVVRVAFEILAEERRLLEWVHRDGGLSALMIDPAPTPC